MGDFYQNGIITNFHNLRQRDLSAIEEDLRRFAQRRPLTLVLPSLFSELEGSALKNIIRELQGADWLTQIVIGLDRADEKQFQFARRFFGELPQRHRILWNDGPRLRALDEELKNEKLAPLEPGKGRNVWYCFGYVLASDLNGAVALHDCDIVTFERGMLARLIYPVASTDFSYQFCKGYYARIADGQLKGRVSRLMVTPLLRALKKMYGPMSYLEYLDSYRYPLAGEFSMRTDVLDDIRIPGDWGLEIGILSEVHRNYTTKRLCQVDITDVYDHKHQPLSEEDPQAGLSRMSRDIALAIFRKMATLGTQFNRESFRTIKATYYRVALDLIETYYDDARMNGLSTDRHEEERAVELFAANLMEAGGHYLDHPMDQAFLPSWNRIRAACPDLLQRLYAAVEADFEDSA